MNKSFFEFKQQTDKPNTLELYIYTTVQDDYITYDWENHCFKNVKSETSADFFRQKLSEYESVEFINVYINSLGGSVMEGVAIYNQLKRHSAFKTVYIDGFACSVASVIAMAGNKVVMPVNAVMMIHNAWTYCEGNAADMRKCADDLDKINEASRQAYIQKSNGKIKEEKLIELLEAESYLTAKDCLEYGFADELAEQNGDITYAKQLSQELRKNNYQQYYSRLESIIATAERSKNPQSPQSTEKTFDEKANDIFKKFLNV